MVQTSEEIQSYSCNMCGAPARAVVQASPTIVCCSECGLSALARFPGKAEIEAAYQEDYYSEGTGFRFLGILEVAIRFFRWLRVRNILRREPGPASLLDVGCGRGTLLEMFQKRGWKVLGTQLSKTATRAARERRGVEVFCGELTDLEVEPRSFRVVTFFHVLEHLDRPVEYLLRANEVLAPGGLLVVEVPDFASPGFRLLGVRNFCVDYPNHLVFFTPETLEATLRKCGFQVESIGHFSVEYSPYTTLQNLLNLLPGTPNRLYRSLMSTREGRRLRRSPWTWLHALLAVAIAPPALVVSASSLVLPWGNTVRLYCRKVDTESDGREVPALSNRDDRSIGRRERL